MWLTDKEVVKNSTGEMKKAGATRQKVTQ